MFTKGQTQIGILTAFGAVTVFIFGWLGWTSMKAIDTAQQTAKIIEWQRNTDENLKDYKNETGMRLEEVAKNNLQTQIDIATIKEFTRLLALDAKYNTTQIEKRVRQNLEDKDVLLSSTTAKGI